MDLNMPRKTYRWSDETKTMELVYDSEAAVAESSGDSHFHYVRGDAADFVSPIDGAVIHGNAGLKRHMKKHGVIPTAELCSKEMARKQEERRQMNSFTHPSQKAARVEAIRNAYEQSRNNARARSRYG